MTGPTATTGPTGSVGDTGATGSTPTLTSGTVALSFSAGTGTQTGTTGVLTSRPLWIQAVQNTSGSGGFIVDFYPKDVSGTWDISMRLLAMGSNTYTISYYYV